MGISLKLVANLPSHFEYGPRRVQHQSLCYVDNVRVHPLVCQLQFVSTGYVAFGVGVGLTRFKDCREIECNFRVFW